MKQSILLLLTIVAFSCGESKKDEQRIIKSINCTDSFDVEQFDQQGNAFMVKQPGKCDTVFEDSEHK